MSRSHDSNARVTPSSPREFARTDDGTRAHLHADVDESALVARVRAGDAEAFESLFRMHFAAMMRFAMSFVADADAAEDIVQDVLGRVWVQHTEWNPTGDVLSYFLAAVRNRALNAVTTERRRTTLVQQWSVPETASDAGQLNDADQALDAEYQSQVIWGAIHALPEYQRTVMLLRWRYGLEWDDIGAIMQTSAVAARKNHSRALQALRKQIPEELK